MIENKTDSPELVDLKITDYCSFGCKFCYQGSTKKGKHADFKKIIKILRDCEENKVFEVAIGGGEPTQHPDFLQILEESRRMDIQVNFTTVNPRFLLLNPGLLKHHSVALSVSQLRTLEIFDVLSDFEKLQFTPQLVSGVVYKWEYDKIIEFCKKKGITPTILGFKETGRGGDFRIVQEKLNIYKPEEELKIALNGLGKVNVDTAMLKACSSETGKICEKLFFTNEGLVSCYIDAVENTIASSSYHKETTIPYSSIKNDWSQLPVV